VPPPKKKTGLILGIVIGVLALVAAGTAVVLLRGSGDDSPEGAVTGFLEAFKDGDVQTMRELTCADLRSQLDSADDFMGDIGSLITNIEFRVTDVVTNGDESSVTVTMTATVMGQTESQTETVRVVREGGQWRVCEP
jgi:hypothetical protein